MLNWLKASGIRRCGLIVKHLQEQRAVPLDNSTDHRYTENRASINSGLTKLNYSCLVELYRFGLPG